MTNSRRVLLLAIGLTLLVVLAGCSFSGTERDSTTHVPTPTVQPTPESPSPEQSTPDPTTRTGYDDPESDVIGWEDGYWHDEPINVSQSDGLTDAELNEFVARGMARVEYLRNAEFEKSVNVSIKTREEHLADNPYSSDSGSAYNEWNNQVWEALFIVGESEDVGAQFEEVTGASVLGYYSPGSKELVIVTDSPDTPTVSNTTLIHELVHALQDQRFNMSRAKYNPATQDAQLANHGLVEGEAKYIEKQYAERCSSGTWDCVSTPASSRAPSNGNVGIQLTMFQPYSDGPLYVEHLIQKGGWEAVDRAFLVPPIQSRQIIHPGATPNEHEFAPPGNVSHNWTRFSTFGQDGGDSVGEASVFVMLWYQNQ